MHYYKREGFEPASNSKLPWNRWGRTPGKTGTVRLESGHLAMQGREAAGDSPTALLVGEHVVVVQTEVSGAVQGLPAGT
jgi:hypothetical protein